MQCDNRFSEYYSRSGAYDKYLLSTKVGNSMHTVKCFKSLYHFAASIILCTFFVNGVSGQSLQVNDSNYFEKPGVNILVFSSQYNGMFFDEKTSGIEIIHHGVRTGTGGAVRLQNTPE